MRWLRELAPLCDDRENAECGGERHGGVARDPGDGVELLARPLGGGQQHHRREHAREHGAAEAAHDAEQLAERRDGDGSQAGCDDVHGAHRVGGPRAQREAAKLGELLDGHEGCAAHHREGRQEVEAQQQLHDDHKAGAPQIGDDVGSHARAEGHSSHGAEDHGEDRAEREALEGCGRELGPVGHGRLDAGQVEVTEEEERHRAEPHGKGRWVPHRQQGERRAQRRGVVGHEAHAGHHAHVAQQGDKAEARHLLDPS
mmetsp:Transcript_5450/g.21504  ORF Transcript_5450/g.21504 Transcript_5450/m.21504 type:complete len:257 (+) Transcript_5450:114-884(+)